MLDWMAVLRLAPIIAAVRGPEQLALALQSNVRMVFLLGADMFTLPEMTQRALAAGKQVFVHMDLMEGVSRDAAGIRWIARAAAPTGVLSTRPQLLRVATEEGMRTVLRIFLVDASSMETGVRMVKTCAPDLVEVMPGLVTRAIRQLGGRIAPPVIAGGMLERMKDVQAVLEAGALAASTSSEALWKELER